MLSNTEETIVYHGKTHLVQQMSLYTYSYSIRDQTLSVLVKGKIVTSAKFVN